MYNSCFGFNSHIVNCVSLVLIRIEDIERFRDAIIKKDDNGFIVEVLTRTGGANRENYPNLKLKENKYFIREFDDPYDCTYAHFEFAVPEEAKIFAQIDENFFPEKILKEQSRKNLDLEQMFENYFEEVKVDGTEANKMARKVVDKIMEGFDDEHEKSGNIEIIRFCGKDENEDDE